MYDLDTIKKVNGEFPPDDSNPTEPLGIEAYDHESVIHVLRTKAARYDEYMHELRSAPLRKNQ